MGSQSDIPSQGGAPARSNVNPFAGLGVANSPDTIVGSTSLGSFTVATFDSRMPNGFDYFAPVIVSQVATDPALNVSALEGVFTVRSGYAFIMRNLQLDLQVSFAQQTPFLAPFPATDPYVTTINGFPSSYLGSAQPTVSCQLSIYANGVPTNLQNIELPYSSGQFDLPLFYAFEPDANVMLRFVCSDPNNGFKFKPFLRSANLFLSGNLIQATGLELSEQIVNSNPIPVTGI